MGKRGPKPKPTATLEQRGSWRAKVRDGEPEMDLIESVPTCPESLSAESSEVWMSLAPRLVGAGILTDADLLTFERYCRAYALWTRKASELECGEMDPREVTALQKLDDVVRRLEGAFGLNPAERSELSVNKKPNDGKSKFFSPKLAG